MKATHKRLARMTDGDKRMYRHFEQRLPDLINEIAENIHRDDCEGYETVEIGASDEIVAEFIELNSFMKYLRR